MGRHSEWRKIAKKCRRSRIRKLKALEREKLLKEREEDESVESFSHFLWQKEQEALELFASIEEQRIQEEENRKWIERELKAQEEWRQSQEKIAAFKAEKAQQEIRIREEWNREQKKIKEIEEKNRREKEERELREREFKQRINDYIEGARNDLPPGFKTNLESKPDKELCPFFAKVGACRFFEHCSRNHIKPTVSKLLLLTNFFTHFSMENKSVGEYDTDMGLEVDEKEMDKYFIEFYEDVMPELRSLGQVTQFKVCLNQSPHLRGNVYVGYATERDALRAYYTLSGRYYGGRTIRAEFCHIPAWSRAICGLFLSNKCHMGGKCNFLHAFRNPTFEFNNADQDKEAMPRRIKSSNANSTNRKSWAWSSDSEDENDSANRTGRHRNSSRRRSRSRDHSSQRSHRSERRNGDWRSASERRNRDSERRNSERSERNSRDSQSERCHSDRSNKKCDSERSNRESNSERRNVERSFSERSNTERGSDKRLSDRSDKRKNTSDRRRSKSTSDDENTSTRRSRRKRGSCSRDENELTDRFRRTVKNTSDDENTTDRFGRTVKNTSDDENTTDRFGRTVKNTSDDENTTDGFGRTVKNTSDDENISDRFGRTVKNTSDGENESTNPSERENSPERDKVWKKKKQSHSYSQEKRKLRRGSCDKDNQDYKHKKRKDEKED